MHAYIYTFVTTYIQERLRPRFDTVIIILQSNTTVSEVTIRSHYDMYLAFAVLAVDTCCRQYTTLGERGNFILVPCPREFMNAALPQPDSDTKVPDVTNLQLHTLTN